MEKVTDSIGMVTKHIELGDSSSPEKIRIHRHPDKSVTLTVLGDTSHGDRVFNLSYKDWEKIKSHILEF